MKFPQYAAVPLLVLVLHPFSGPASELGTEMRAGALSYFDFVNKQGGVHGRRPLGVLGRARSAGAARLNCAAFRLR